MEGRENVDMTQKNILKESSKRRGLPIVFGFNQKETAQFKKNWSLQILAKVYFMLNDISVGKFQFIVMYQNFQASFVLCSL